ncbi:MAG TPA: hypothetical protein VKA21_14860 [Candidatus Binatia bacterium]|nr:hypothetical protein [Candidatus Binatia bacterium]
MRIFEEKRTPGAMQISRKLPAPNGGDALSFTAALLGASLGERRSGPPDRRRRRLTLVPSRRREAPR